MSKEIAVLFFDFSNAIKSAAWSTNRQKSLQSVVKSLICDGEKKEKERLANSLILELNEMGLFVFQWSYYIFDKEKGLCPPRFKVLFTIFIGRYSDE